MRLAEQHEDHRIGMPLANFGDLRRGMTITRSNLPQVFPRHAIKAIDSFAMIASRDQQFVERRPVVSPIQIKTNALPQFALIDFAPPPFFENVLIAGENGFDSEHDADGLRPAPAAR